MNFPGPNHVCRECLSHRQLSRDTETRAGVLGTSINNVLLIGEYFGRALSHFHNWPVRGFYPIWNFFYFFFYSLDEFHQLHRTDRPTAELTTVSREGDA